MWAMRIVHEASLCKHDHGNSFITLTYRSQEQCDVEQREKALHVPSDWSLDLDHFQKFMKRLRKATKHRIRFFMCGEYGMVCRHGLSVSDDKDYAYLPRCEVCSVGRPHYHAILFNRSFDDLEPYSKRRGSVLYTSSELEGLWKYGFVTVGEVTLQSAGYVARYCLKKVTGERAQAHYESVDENGEICRVQPEFCTMSRGYTCKGCDECGESLGERRLCAKSDGGIGKRWFDRYKGDLFPSDEVPIPGFGIVPKVPRYYADMYSELDPEGFEAVKERRQEFRAEHADDYTTDRLMDRYKVHRARSGNLKRSL